MEATKVFYNTFISAKLGLVNMIQDVAERLGNMNVDVVTNALAMSDQRIMGPKYMTAGMGDGGSCHPRDNIALRWMAQEQNLGYDLFHAIMDAREKQAKNMAEAMLKYDMPCVIVGKAFKPGVDYEFGSPSILTGAFIEGKQPLYYLDPMTGDTPPADLGPAVYLLAHNYDVTYFKQEAGVSKSEAESDFSPVEGSVIIDPWRRQEDIEGVKVVHYGNTRK
jgi:UDPglucose 6-dehydrogenase